VRTPARRIAVIRIDSIDAVAGAITLK